MSDPLAELLPRLETLADPGFRAPPLDAALAESVLGAAGAPRTPHRRLLERMNGAYLFGRALHLFGACAAPAWHSLEAWNAADLWRDAYGALARELVFFAEDALGEQFAYRRRPGDPGGGEVVVFEAELGRVAAAAPHFVAWLEALVATPEALLPVRMLADEEARGRPLAPGEQLFAYPPLCTIEARSEGVSLGMVDAVEAMRFRGELARQIHDLPPGARVRIELEDPGGARDPGGKR